MSARQMTFPSDVATAVSARTRTSPSSKPPQTFSAAAITRSAMGSPLWMIPVGSPNTSNEEFTASSPSVRAPGSRPRSPLRRGCGRSMPPSGGGTSLPRGFLRAVPRGSRFTRFPMKLLREMAARSGRSNRPNVVEMPAEFPVVVIGAEGGPDPDPRVEHVVVDPCSLRSA